MLHPVSSLAGLGAGCSAMSWETEDRRHLWGRNLDFNTLASDSRITYIPRGTSYATCEQRPESRFCSAYAAVGTGLLSVSLSPLLYEGINDQGLMGGQLYYREFACYEGFPRPGTAPVQPPVLVYHLLAQCATVAEVVHTLREELTLLDLPLLGAVPPLHWSFSDRTGETIVVEPDRDGLHIYRNTLGVMTNSPGYLWHRTNLLNYAGIRDLDHGAMELAGQQLTPCFSGSGAQGLPGDWSSPSRFVRLAFLKTYGVKGATESAGVGAHVPPAPERRLSAWDGACAPAGVSRRPGRRHSSLRLHRLYRRGLCGISSLLLDHLRKSADPVCGSLHAASSDPARAVRTGPLAGFPGAGPCVCICGLSHLICLLVVIPTDSRRYL